MPMKRYKPIAARVMDSMKDSGIAVLT